MKIDLTPNAAVSELFVTQLINHSHYQHFALADSSSIAITMPMPVGFNMYARAALSSEVAGLQSVFHAAVLCRYWSLEPAGRLEP